MKRFLLRLMRQKGVLTLRSYSRVSRADSQKGKSKRTSGNRRADRHLYLSHSYPKCCFQPWDADHHRESVDYDLATFFPQSLEMLDLRTTVEIWVIRNKPSIHNTVRKYRPPARHAANKCCFWSILLSRSAYRISVGVVNHSVYLCGETGRTKYKTLRSMPARKRSLFGLSRMLPLLYSIHRPTCSNAYQTALKTWPSLLSALHKVLIVEGTPDICGQTSL